MSRSEELAIICSNTTGWELTPYREAVKIIEDLEAECAEWGKRAKSAGEYLERKVSQRDRCFATLTVDQAERILLALKDAREVNRMLWKEFPDNDSCPIAHHDLHDSLAEITDHDLAALGDAEAAARLIVHPGEPLPETKVRGR